MFTSHVMVVSMTLANPTCNILVHHYSSGLGDSLCFKIRSSLTLRKWSCYIYIISKSLEYTCYHHLIPHLMSLKLGKSLLCLHSAASQGYGWHRSNRSDVQSRTSALTVRGIPWGDGDTPRNGGSLRGRKGGRCVHDSYYLTLDILLLLCMVLKIEIWFFFLFNSFCQVGFLQKPIHTSLHPIFTQRDRWLKLTLAKFCF